ncbi:hypothetical protein [Gimesia aquarii]|uniref:DUF3106 domain-containing protein n=1 Tax=Gimesia aquarii TaxID=2527964 RepID=A0A517W4U5_9PLAN|nr:hypothetical protein [Gimesia aquarii]QDU00264.1 hypothetical protein V144x_57770 [Gimesia aquarii]
MKPRSSKNNQRRSKEPSQSASRQPALWSRSLRAVGFGIGTVICVMVLLGASGQNEDQETENRKKIEAMTPAERAQLKRNYEKFQKLSAKEKQRFRELHSATRSQPELNRVMRSYCDWVKTLTPWEQEELRNAKDKSQRLELIRKFRSRHSRSSRHSNALKYSEMLNILGIRDPRYRYFLSSPPPPDLFKRVIDIIEQSLPAPVKYPKPKDQLSDFERSLAVLQSGVKSKGNKHKEQKTYWPSPEVVEEVYDLIQGKNDSFLELRGPRELKSFAKKAQPRAIVTIFLIRGLMGELATSVQLKVDELKPSDEELQKFFERSLDHKARDNLLKYPPDEMQKKLMYDYFLKNAPKDVQTSLRFQGMEAIRLAVQLRQGSDFKWPGPESRRRETKDRAQDGKNRRLNGPKGGGDRNFPGRKPERRPGVQRRDRPDA